VIEALSAIAANYNNLEYDLTEGERGGRAAYLERSLALVCGAEAATVVNNCAAALVLVLRHFTSTRREVLISRGELVQIGGGFRIPEILEASGARLREVGTTNKTAVEDYARAITAESALILKVHRSNFLMDGFVASPAREQLAQLARRKRLPFVEDLGSGAIVATEQYPDLEHEPTPREVLNQGVDLVTFSGDKLLGGPQAGIVAGRKKQVAALKREPFFRALRCDKLILAALQATVDAYLNGKPGESVLTLSLLQTSVTDLEARAELLRTALHGLPLRAEVRSGNAEVGGGSLPRSWLPSVTLDLIPTKLPVQEFLARLRAGTPPVIGYIAGGRCKLDLRTVFPSQDAVVLRRIREAASS
jgi:L-seryl-tRNA(Ser) seleniumtransferase